MGLLFDAVVNLSLAAPGKFDYGFHGDVEIEVAAQSVLNTFMDWLAEMDTEVELGIELMRAQRPMVDDLTAARAQVREVCDVLIESLEKHVGRVS